MTMETDLQTRLSTLCPRVFPDFAPLGTATPYITHQSIGGRPLRWTDNTPADKRNTFVQVNVWSATRAEALQLIRQVEELLCNPAAPFVAWPQSEPINTSDPEFSRYGCIQDFEILSSR